MVPVVIRTDRRSVVRPAPDATAHLRPDPALGPGLVVQTVPIEPVPRIGP
jgi:hypothetical protein